MVFGNKENKFLLPYRIYRGTEVGGEGVDIPIPKTVDFFDQKKTFGDKLATGAYLGFLGGGTFALNDIFYHTHLREAKARLLRFTYFTAPTTMAGIGYVAALELAKKYTETYQGAYCLAAIIPAGIDASWRRDIRRFPKTFGFMAAAGFCYATLVDENASLSWLSSNPNAPSGQVYRKHHFLDWPHKEHVGPKLDWEWMSNKDPGPTYAKWEK